MTNLIVNHNSLDTSIYKMSPIELKLMHYCITKVRRDGGFSKENRLFEIRHEDFAWLIGRDNCYNSMKAAVKRLQQQIVTINEPITDADGVTHAGGAINVLSAQYWAEDEGYIKLEFSDRFMPYLTKLAGDYNKLFFEDIAHMKSTHSIRLYKLMRSHHNTNQKYGRDDSLLIEVSVLREAFELGAKYKVHQDFKKYVINRAVDEINSLSPLHVEYKQVKRGRKIHAYSFKVTDKAKPLPAKSKAAKQVQKACDAIVRAYESDKVVQINGRLVVSIMGGLVNFEEGSANLFELVKKGVEINITQKERLL